MFKKRLFYVAVMAISCQLLFIACGSDKDNELPPAQKVSQLSFLDTDLGEGTIGGNVTWTLPDPEVNIVKYYVYLSSDQTLSGATRLGEVAAGTTSFTIPAGTPYKPYINVTAGNNAGESSAIASVAIEDMTPGQGPYPFKMNGVYVLNSGMSGANNATLDYIMFDPDIAPEFATKDVFEKNNNRKLGELANDMIIYGSKMYIAVTGSKTIEITDLSARSLKQLNTAGEPRSLLSYAGSVYATFSNGDFCRIDTSSMDILLTMKVGRSPEQLVESKGKIYVANSGGMDFPDYDKTVSVIDPAEWKEIKKIEVAENPINMATDNAGNVYVASMGDYSAPPVLQVINPDNDAVEIISGAKPTEMVSNGSMIYMFYAGYDENWQPLPITFGTYQIAAKSFSPGSWMTSAPPANPYKMFVDPNTGHLFFTSGDYSANGTISVYLLGTTLYKTWEVGFYPVKACFLQEDATFYIPE